MKSTVYVLSMVLAVAMVFIHCTGPSFEFREANLGDPAPLFRLEDLQGNEVSLDQYRGKIVMLDFWATWCGPCRRSMPMLEELQKRNPDDFVLLAVNLQEPDDLVRDYIRRHDLRTRVLMDREGEVGRAYRSDSIPMQVLIDKKGVVRHVKVGYHPRMGEQLQSEIQKLRAD